MWKGCKNGFEKGMQKWLSKHPFNSWKEEGVRKKPKKIFPLIVFRIELE